MTLSLLLPTHFNELGNLGDLGRNDGDEAAAAHSRVSGRLLRWRNPRKQEEQESRWQKNSAVR